MTPRFISEMFRSIASSFGGITNRRTDAVVGGWGMCALLLLLAAASSTPAQSVDVRTQPIRVTFADSGSQSLALTNFLDLGTTNPVDLNISGLPSGVTASYTSLTGITNDFGTNLVLNGTSVSQGEYIINLDASGGATNSFQLILQSGRMWTGNTNVTTDWSSGSSWVGGVAPTSTSDVLFTQLGAQTNVTGTFSNSVVSANTEVASIRFSQTNGNARFHTISISPGRTLSVTGNRGFKILRDTTANDLGASAEMQVRFVGPQGRLVVSNQNAEIDLLTFNGLNNSQQILDLSELGTFVADVRRLALGDYLAYPNYTNLAANGYSGNAFWKLPRQFFPTVRLARTNIITGRFVDPNDFMDPARRFYSLMLANNEGPGTANNTVFNFGISNLFKLYSLNFVGSGAQSDGGVPNRICFLPGLVVETIITAGPTTNSVTNAVSAFFRNTNGVDRMSLFALSDAAGVGGSGSGVNSIVDFSAGTVNALVDRLYLSRGRTNSANANVTAVLTVGAGVFDANTAILGFQDQGNNLATNEPPQNGFSCQGTVNLVSNAVFKVNNTLELGYTTQNEGATNGNANAGFGQINIGSNATLMANSILIGGVTKLSGNNTITVTGGDLIVSNKIATSDKWLTSFTLNNASTLTLHLNGTNTDYYVYVTNLTSSGGLNALNIGSVANLVIPPEGTNVPIFIHKGNVGAADFPIVTMPSPMRGAVVQGPDIDPSTHTAELTIITNEPKNLVWRGSGLTDTWNLTTKNWLDTATGLLTNYINGDAVLFDDLAGAADNIIVTNTLIPDSVVVSNSSGGNVFVLSGSGSIVGTSLVKNGNGSLAIDGTASIPVLLNNGTLTGVGLVSSVTVASGATLNFSGTISPSGVICAGTAILRGSTVGPLNIQSSGVVTNADTGTTQGPITTQSGALLYNAGHLGNGGVGIGSSTIVSNATFINAGNIGASAVNSSLAISGIFREMGVIGKDIYLTLLDINGGVGTNNNNAGTFIPGGDGIGVTTIKSPGIAGVTFSGRVRFGVGSTNIFKVDTATTNTVLQATWIDYGPSIGNPGFEGGFIWLTNVGAGPFAAGQRFGLFKYEDGTLPIQFGSTNSYPLMIPTVPGPALAWDLSDVKMNGNVGIRSYSTNLTNITFSSSYTLVTNLTSTNRGIVLTLQWPSSHIGGWHVEEQTSTRAVGIQMGASNWAPIFASYFTNQINVTNVIGANNIGFYRLVSP